mmetsp:Transcript_39565/g.70972  ORF Transcript_39565/g.70972 Transcript_39565/m.70972 type:complete len:88 (-) Transcript_39565:134-397(-)
MYNFHQPCCLTLHTPPASNSALRRKGYFSVCLYAGKILETFQGNGDRGIAAALTLVVVLLPKGVLSHSLGWSHKGRWIIQSNRWLQW